MKMIAHIFTPFWSPKYFWKPELYVVEHFSSGSRAPEPKYFYIPFYILFSPQNYLQYHCITVILQFYSYHCEFQRRTNYFNYTGIYLKFYKIIKVQITILVWPEPKLNNFGGGIRIHINMHYGRSGFRR